jgi:arylsulfatase A-like enzyme
MEPRVDAAVRRPNILVFMTDQQRAETVLPGHRLKAHTPHLDRFRTTAVDFRNAHAPAPHCCPSRTSFFTSLYPSEHGVWNNVNVTNALTRGPRPGVRFWSEDFVAAGYRLAFTGKWHVSNWQGPDAWGWEELLLHPALPGRDGDPDAQRRAARRDELARLADGHDDPSTAAARIEGEVVRPGWTRYVHYGADEDPFRDAEVVQAGVDFLSGQRDAVEPWMLYVGTLGPHDPYTPPQRFLDLYDLDDIELPPTFAETMEDKPALYRRTRGRFDQLTEQEHRQSLRHYLAFCTYQDDLFGRLLGALEATGQLDDTIVVYLSDHGDYTGDFGLWGKGLPSMQPAYHVPALIGGGAARFPPGEVTVPVSLLDIGPTLLDLAGVPAAGAGSGTSLVPWLRAERSPDEPRDLFFQSNGNEAYGIQRIVISDGWKLVHNLFDYDELYDLEADPEERRNLLAPAGHAERRVGIDPLAAIPPEHAETVRRLFGKLWRLGLDHDDENINEYILTALAPFGPLVADEERPTLARRPK